MCILTQALTKQKSLKTLNYLKNRELNFNYTYILFFLYTDEIKNK